MTGRVVFAASEFDPIVPGGAGSVVARLAERLGPDRASTLLVAPRSGVVKPDLPTGVIWVEVPEPNGSADWFVDRSRKAAEALSAHVDAEGRPDLVEFQDFEALSWWALSHRHELGLEHTRIGIRVHGPVDAIIDAVGSRPPVLAAVSGMEREAFKMADVVLAPSDALGAWAIGRYRLESDRVVEAPPPLPPVEPREWRPTEDPTFVFYGRLAEAKGVQDLALALVTVLDANPEARVLFIGPDDWSLADRRPMSEVLSTLIPSRVSSRVEMTGRLPREEALDRVATAWAAVFPSRFESFCLSCHEARRVGVPVIVPDLPAFDGLGEDLGALKYDGSVDALARLLASVASDRSLVESLAGRPAPRVGDATLPYAAALPAVRHVNSQAALATLAVSRLEQAMALSTDGRIARRVLRVVPRRIARLAARLLPQGAKDRFRERASWWEEEARRTAADRLRATERQIEAGSFTEEEKPRTTVVIPCYNQGGWVESAVLSVFEQTDRSWEIVLIDDGSTDRSTIATLDRLAVWPRVRLIRQENAGLPGARNAGVNVANGDYIVPLDGDDELHPEYLEAMTASLEEEPDAAYAHCWGRYIGNMNAYWITRPFNPYQILLSNSVLGCATIRADALRSVGCYDETLIEGNEDWDLWLRFLERGWVEVEVRRPLFKYRMRGHSMSADTLAGFEQARLAIRDRHPVLYEHDRIVDTKSTWYPWVTVLSEEGGGIAGQDLLDMEEAVVSADSASLAKAISVTRGKVVVEWDLLADPPPGALRVLAEALESNPAARCAIAQGIPVAWRRWSLHDPDAPLVESVVADLRVNTDRSPRLRAAIAPRPEWIAPDDLPEPGLPVIRQRPEEEGPLPAWLTGEPQS